MFIYKYSPNNQKQVLSINEVDKEEERKELLTEKEKSLNL